MSFVPAAFWFLMNTFYLFVLFSIFLVVFYGASSGLVCSFDVFLVYFLSVGGE